MIVDLKRFIETERETWEELDKSLARIENEPHLRLTLEDVQRLHYLYERTGAGLIKVSTFAAEPNLVHSLEALLARGVRIAGLTQGSSLEQRVLDVTSGP